MLISGVRADGPAAGAGGAPIMSIRALFHAASTLGREAVDTRSNADEVARWLQRAAFRSIRLVTNDCHMRRARFEIGRRLGADVTIVADAVRDAARTSRQCSSNITNICSRRAAGLVGL